MHYRSIAYVFVKGNEKAPSYQILSNGELWKFNGEFQEPHDIVYMTAEEVRGALQPASSRDVWKRCHAMFRRIKRHDSGTRMVSEGEQSELETELREKSVLLR